VTLRLTYNPTTHKVVPRFRCPTTGLCAYILIEEALVCASFVFVLKLTNNSKVHFMKFAVLR
jgi:hypothetical protein